jgi:hypothetical protein
MMNLQHITPELIPHTEFHKGTWLLPVNGADWYYFMKKQPPHIITNKNFISSVDKPLRDLVRFFHKKKIKTTPSCSGHHFKVVDLEKIYDDLEEDRHKINTVGLELKDVETGEIFQYRDPHYNLPWRKTGFLKQVKDYQQKGVIGFETGDNRQIKDELLRLHIDGAKIIAKDKMIFILTVENKYGDNTSLWRRITKQIKEVFTKMAAKRRIFSSENRTV